MRTTASGVPGVEGGGEPGALSTPASTPGCSAEVATDALRADRLPVVHFSTSVHTRVVALTRRAVHSGGLWGSLGERGE